MAVLIFKVLYEITPEYLGPVVRIVDLPGLALRSARTHLPSDGCATNQTLHNQQSDVPGGPSSRLI